MTQYFHRYEPPTPAKELLGEFRKRERGAKNILKGLSIQ